MNTENNIKMPVLFVGHGSPMNAIEDNKYSRGWSELGENLPKPRAILCVSAHWVTQGTEITAMENPRTIYDFYGFPKELYEVEYPAKGSPELAEQVIELIKGTEIEKNYDWGLDHGTWSILHRMFPDADIPVVQLSLNDSMTPQEHYNLAKELAPLREMGIMIISSGNVVHNLGMMSFEIKAYDWAIEFNNFIKGAIESGGHQSVIEYEKFGNSARLSVPTNEHYLPVLYSLALKEPSDKITFFNEGYDLGSISMLSFVIG